MKRFLTTAAMALCLAITTTSVAQANVGPYFKSFVRNATVYAHQTFTYVIQVEDADGDPVTVNAYDGPAGMTFDAATNTVTWSAGGPGLYNFKVTATDGQTGDGHTITREVTIAVTAKQQ